MQKKKYTLELPRFYSKPKNEGNDKSNSKEKERTTFVKNDFFRNPSNKIKNGKAIKEVRNLYDMKTENLSGSKYKSKQSESPYKPLSVKKISVSNEKTQGVIKYSKATDTTKKLIVKKFLTEDKDSQGNVSIVLN